MQTPEAKQKFTALPFYSFTDITFGNLKTPDERTQKMAELINEEKEYAWMDMDNDVGLVSAQGTWMSDTELANKANTVVLECWKSFNHCFASQAEITEYGGLYLGTDLYEITSWGYDEIKAKSGTTFGCFEYELTVDRINQKVFSIRKQTGTDGLCEGMSDKPLMIYLSDQFKNKNGN